MEKKMEMCGPTKPPAACLIPMRTAQLRTSQLTTILIRFGPMAGTFCTFALSGDANLIEVEMIQFQLVVAGTLSKTCIVLSTFAQGQWLRKVDQLRGLELEYEVLIKRR